MSVTTLKSSDAPGSSIDWGCEISTRACGDKLVTSFLATVGKEVCEPWETSSPELAHGCLEFVAPVDQFFVGDSDLLDHEAQEGKRNQVGGDGVCSRLQPGKRVPNLDGKVSCLSRGPHRVWSDRKRAESLEHHLPKSYWLLRSYMEPRRQRLSREESGRMMPSKG